MKWSDFKRGIRAVGEGFKALFRAYDDVEGISPGGFPKLRGWKQDHPLEKWTAGTNSEESRISGAKSAFVFMEGRDRGEAVYLPTGLWTLGTGSQNRFTIRSKQSSERKLQVQVEGASTTLISEWDDAPLCINGNQVKRAVLVDQDECRFEGAVFYYVDLKL